MSTIREQIVAKAFDALSTDLPEGIPVPQRTRLDSPTADQLPALTLYQGDEVVAHQRDPKPGEASHATRGSLVRRYLPVIVEVLAARGEGVVEDEACDPSLAWAEKAICTNGLFAGLANYVDVLGTGFRYEQKETSFCRAILTILVEFQTKTGEPESRK